MSRMVIGYGSSSQRSLMNLIREISADSSRKINTVYAADGAVLVRIKRVIIHPDFDDSMSNDLAIIEVFDF